MVLAPALSRAKGLLALAVIAAAMAAPDVTQAAQKLGLGAGSNNPIQVYADNGIEWDRNARQYIARGNAKAIQGDTTVYGDTLVAYYEAIAGGNTEVYRLDALGNVRIVSPTETAYGDKAVYDVRGGVLVMTGKNLRFVTADELITARDSLEYYEQKNLAVARGNAVSRPRASDKGRRAAEGSERTVRADILTAHFRDNAAKKPKAGAATRGNSLERMDAWGNVVVTRPGEISRGSRGVYFPARSMANLWGKVRITRGDNQLNGDFAEINFRTGISRILAGPTAPVQALIEQEKSRPAPPDTQKTSPKSKN